MTDQCFDKCIAMFLAANRNISLTIETLEVWKKLLIDVSDLDFIFAVTKVCNEENIFPTSNLVPLVRNALKGNIENKALLAWEKVLKGASKAGVYKSVQFDEPIIHSCINLIGGWNRLCTAEAKELVWIQKDFIKLYKTLGKRKHPKYLLGIHETKNSLNYKNEKPIFIGEREQKLLKKG